MAWFRDPHVIQATFLTSLEAGRIVFRPGWDHGNAGHEIDKEEDNIMFHIYHFVNRNTNVWLAAYGVHPFQQNQRLLVSHGWHNIIQGGGDPRWHIQVYVENTVTLDPGTPFAQVVGTRVQGVSATHIYLSGQQSQIIGQVPFFTQAR